METPKPKAPIDQLLDTVQWEVVEGPLPDNPDGLPHITHKGVLNLGGIELPCAVLSDGQRIFYGELIDEMMANLPTMGLDAAAPLLEGMVSLKTGTGK